MDADEAKAMDKVIEKIKCKGLELEAILKKGDEKEIVAHESDSHRLSGMMEVVMDYGINLLGTGYNSDWTLPIYAAMNKYISRVRAIQASSK